MKEIKQGKVPILRFPGFTGPWHSNSLGKLCKVNQGLQINISERFPEPGINRYFYITNEFLKKGSKKKYYIKSPNKSVLCEEEDVLMTRTGNTGIVVTGVKGAFHNNFFKINYDKKTIDKKYLVLFLRDRKTKHVILTYAGQSTIPDLNHKDFYSLKINLPPIKEQQKIASFFALLDQKIEKQQEKIEQLELFKKGMMQKIFSQEIRFKDEDGGEFPEWKEKKLGEIATFLKGNSISKSNLSEDGHPCVLYGEIYTKYSEVILKVVSRTNLVSDKLIKGYKNDVLIPSSGETAIDIACATALEVNDVYLGGDINIIRPKDGVNGTFISYELNHARKKALVRVAQGATVVHLYNTSLKSILILLPQKEEQQKIASFLTLIDKKIEKEKEKLEALQQQKKAFLQQMFI